MNILLAIDGSDHANRVVEALLGFVPALKVAPVVHLLYVHLPIPVGFAVKHVPREVVESYYREEGQAILKPTLECLVEAGLVVQSHVRVGSPGETIAHAASELECAGIWLGTHGRGSISQALLGSVAMRVIALTRVPVTLVK